mgnify:CR=1 FL=1
MRATLPAGVIGPFFNDDFGDVYGSIYALRSDGFSPEEIRVHAERIRDRLLQVPDVAKVQLFGVQPERIYVEVSQRKLAQLGIELNQVVALISAQNVVEGAGTLDAGSENLALETAPHGIGVFVIHPGDVITPMAESLKTDDAVEWLPWTRRHFGKNAIPVERPANLVRWLAAGKGDALSGCYISIHDDVEQLAAQAQTIQAEELQRLRLRQITRIL